MTRPDEAVLRVGEEEIALPVIVGTEDEVAVDINKLRAASGTLASSSTIILTFFCSS